MDCNTARMLATFFGRQGSELAPEDAAALSTRTSPAAPGVPPRSGPSGRSTTGSRKAMLAVPVPSGLKAKILDGVTAQKAAGYRQKAWGLVGPGDGRVPAGRRGDRVPDPRRPRT